MATEIGIVKSVNGPVIKAEKVQKAQMLELVEVGELHLVGEIVRLDDDEIMIQVYEDTTGVKPGDTVYGTGLPLSVELGPGVLTNIYDGIQRPLEKIKEKSGLFIERGVQIDAIDKEKKWAFTPTVKNGDFVKPGDVLGTVPETDTILNKIMVPPGLSGHVVAIKAAGDYTVSEIVAQIEKKDGTKTDIAMYQRWPIRKPRPVSERLESQIPMITGQRVIDTLFPIAKGGTAIVPGGFGTGKTMVQHALAMWSDVDIIVYIGCGERGNEMTDVLREFPHLIDPRTNKSIMERTVLIANTSNMPVSAREASIYTGVTIAEYYRDMGYHVAIMADSTSRWAEALRELGGRMEEMPGDEGFPAYLPSRLAQFYERAGFVKTLNQEEGSISIIGAVSPPGGDFSEPVTQHSKRFVRVFWALDRQLANARHYPAIGWLESYSEYVGTVQNWWHKNVNKHWAEFRSTIMNLLQEEVKLQQIVKLVGPDALPDNQRFILDICNLFKNAFLQQNAFDKIDRFSVPNKQFKMLEAIHSFYIKGRELLKQGWTLLKLRDQSEYAELSKMKFNISNEEYDKIDSLIERIKKMGSSVIDSLK